MLSFIPALCLAVGAFTRGAVADDDHMGINCKGSGMCDGMWMDTLNHTKNTILNGFKDGSADPDRVFHDGEFIACVAQHFCISYENGGSGTVKEAVDYIDELRSFGCEKCGSIPTLSGDIADGSFRSDWIWNHDYKCTNFEGDYSDPDGMGQICSDEDRRWMAGSNDVPDIDGSDPNN